MMAFLDKRINVICDQLRQLRFKQTMALTDMQYKEGNFFRPADADNACAPWQAFDCKTMHWYGPDKHYWFRTAFTVPQSFEGKTLFINVRTQIEEWDDAKNPQFLLFMNGEILQGIDMNHRLVRLSYSATAGQALTLDFQAYTGTLHTEFNLLIDICEVDLAIEKLYFDLYTPLQAFPRMAKDDKARIDMEAALNEAINQLDFRVPYSPAFYEGLKRADEHIQKALYTDLAGYDDVIASVIGHTHIDVAWWWTVEQTREKVARSFATVLKYMDEYPEYKFMSSQPQLYAFLKIRYPELYEKVLQRIKEKRWEPEGGMWLEADCNLTSGESLVRQFLHGKKFFKDELNVDCRVLWLPDVFGYSGALPQIMKKSGIDYFMTTKLSWNQFNKVPYDSLMWRGIDGSEVFTHFISTLGVGQDAKNFFTTYNGYLHPDALMGAWERYQNKEINSDVLISYGYGDGGGGPTREMLEMDTRLRKGLKGIPKTRQVFAGQYFEELYNKVKDHKRLPTWEGEFYFEYHRGTYTSMARNKRANRKSELGLMEAEWLAVLTREQKQYPVEAFHRLWENVLLNQFHDILPGSSIHEVYEVTKREYEAIAKELVKIKEERLSSIVAEGEGITLFNPTGFTRDDVVALGDTHASALQDEAGKIYPVQQTDEGAVAFVENLPSKGYKTFKKAVEIKTEAPFNLNGQVFDTPFYTIAFDENGLMPSFVDKRNGRQLVQKGKALNLLRMYEDKPIYYDNWDIDIFYTEKSWDITDVLSMQWTEMGPVRATLTINRQASQSPITQKIHFYAHSPRIDFETQVDWKDSQHLLKVHFPLALHADEATFDIQFGNVTRKTHTNTSWDQARFESCAHKWVDVSEGHYGVSLLNDCKYGHSVKNGEMAITLIKSGIEPNPVTDQEMHVFTYAMYPHLGTWREAETVKQGYYLNQPVFLVAGGSRFEGFSLVKVDQPNVVIETVKEAEDGDGIILRLYECDNALTNGVLYFEGTFSEAYSCDLMEANEETLSVSGKEISFTIKPYEILTIRIK